MITSQLIRVIKRYYPDSNNKPTITYIAFKSTNAILSNYKTFSEINAICVTKEMCAKVDSLKKKYKAENVRIHCTDINIMASLDKLKSNILYIPIDSIERNDGKSFYEGMEIVDIINKYRNADTFIVYAPKGYNFQHFMSNKKYQNINIYRNTKKKYYYMFITNDLLD